MPNYLIAGSWTIKSLIEIKGGLSFYIVDADDTNKEYMIQRFDRTLEKGKNITVHFSILKEHLIQVGRSHFNKVFFRIKNQCCNIENKIRIVNFGFNLLSHDTNSILDFSPYTMFNDLIKSHIMNKNMHNGSLQVVK